MQVNLSMLLKSIKWISNFIKLKHIILLFAILYFNFWQAQITSQNEPRLVLPIGHTREINSAVFSPDGTRILTASWDNTAKLWDAESGKLLQNLEGHNAWVESAVFSSDGTSILTASWDNTAKLWDAESGKLLQNLEGHTSAVVSAVFSPDGTSIVTASWDKTAKLWDAKSGKLLQNLEGHTSTVESAVFSSDGTSILTASWDNTAKLWDSKSGKLLQNLEGHIQAVNSAVFSPDGTSILTASDDNTAKLWDSKSGKLLQNLEGHTSWLNSAVFSPDGKYVLTIGVDHKTILWDVATGKPHYTRLQLENNDWLVYDEHYRFDGTQRAIDYLYFTCGLEVLDLAQLKDSLWVPGLVGKIMNNEEILINDKPAPKLKDLNICDLTPQIEVIDNGEQGFFRFKITPRNGGLGQTEVYINGNLTYTIQPKELKKINENSKEFYYLDLTTDSIQQFLEGPQLSLNPIVVKCKVKNSGIYGRGVEVEVAKTQIDEEPEFWGVFIGVNDYGNPSKERSELKYPDLGLAKKDAEDMANAVETVAKTLFDPQKCHIFQLTGTGISDSVPSRANLQKVLEEIAEKSKANDVLYIFFAGHGDVTRKNEQDEIRFILNNADKKNLFSSSFGVQELSDWCHPMNIKAQKRVFVFDACHSGQMINETMAFNGRGDDEGLRIRQLDKLKDKNGMMILAASADDQSAFEDERLDQGVLTYHLLQAMKAYPDTSLIIRDWFEETIKLVNLYTQTNPQKNQVPSSFGDGRFEIGNINDFVRQSIDIQSPKKRIAKCIFLPVDAETESFCPDLENKINLILQSSKDFVLDDDSRDILNIQGTYVIKKKNIEVKFRIKKGDEVLSDWIILEQIKKVDFEEQIPRIGQEIMIEIIKIMDSL
jgi:WD40 repeat protein